MDNSFAEIQRYIKETLKLTGKSLYKTIEFQLLFKVFYISILFFIVNFSVSFILDVIDLLITQFRLGETLEDIPFLSLFDFRFGLALIVSIFVIIYVYLVEKNGVTIITTEYYRNSFISFFKTLFLSMRKTPLFIFRRLVEMRFVILVFILFFILWKFLLLLDLATWFMNFFATGLILYGGIIFFSILFRYTFTAYITCLEPKESPEEFNEKLPPKFLRKRTYVSILFYFFLFLSFLLWVLLFYIIVQTLFALATTFPSLISTAIAFFIAFTIVSILIILSLLKTFKVSLMTVLYYEERERQNKTIMIQSTRKQPRLSKDLRLAILTIFLIALAGGAILTTSIKTKTDRVINNAEEYAQQLQEEGLFVDIEDLTLQEMIEKTLSQEKSTIETVEQIVLTYLIFIINK